MQCARVGVLIVAVLGLTGESVCQLEQIEQLIGRAETRLEDDRREDAAAVLAEAWRELRATKAKDRRKKLRLQKRLTALLRQADPKGLTRLKLLQKTAADLEELAADYREKGWVKTAVDLLEQVEALDPGRVRQDLLAAREELAPDPNAILFDYFERAKPLFRGDPWKKCEGWIESPPMQPGEPHFSQSLVGGRPVIGDLDVHVEIQMTVHPGKAGILFGCRDEDPRFHLLEIVHRDNDTVMYLRRYEGSNFHLEYTHVGTLTPEVRKGFIPLRLRIRGSEISATLGDMPSFQTRIDGSIEGKVGFFISRDTTNPDPVRFRHLIVEEI